MGGLHRRAKTKIRSGNAARDAVLKEKNAKLDRAEKNRHIVKKGFKNEVDEKFKLKKKKNTSLINFKNNSNLDLNAVDDEDEFLVGTIDLPLTLATLQDKIKRDPEAYENEFVAQVRHFESVLETLLLNPQKPDKTFDGQVMFISHCVQFYKNNNTFPQKLMTILDEHYLVLHPLTRKILVQALILLRNRNQYELIEAMKLHFKLLSLEDKNIRKIVFSHIVRDILKMNQISQDLPINKKLQQYFFDQLTTTTSNNKKSNTTTSNNNNNNNNITTNNNKNNNKSGNNISNNNHQIEFSSNYIIARKSLIILITLYKKNIWRNSSVVNQIALCCDHPDLHTSKAACQFLLGNLHLIEDSEDALGDDEKNKDLMDQNEKKKQVGEITKDIMGRKKFQKGDKKKKLEKQKKKALKKIDQKEKKAVAKSGFEASNSFAAIDLLHDPQRIAERLLVRVMKKNEPYKFRVLCLQLCSRLMGRHELLVLNFYPYIMKYLVPTQREITLILACVAQSCHSMLPPDEIKPIVKHLINTFVNETNAPEVITVGINSLREIACRCPLALDEEQINDVCGFKKYKHKGVRVGVKSMINMYRELNPLMLQKQYRGKEASEAIIKGDLAKIEYGIQREDNYFDKGVNMLIERKLNKKLKKKEDSDEEEDSDHAIGGSDQEEEDSDEEDSEIVNNEDTAPKKDDETEEDKDDETEEDSEEFYVSDAEEKPREEKAEKKNKKRIEESDDEKGVEGSDEDSEGSHISLSDDCEIDWDALDHQINTETDSEEVSEEVLEEGSSEEDNDDNSRSEEGDNGDNEESRKRKSEISKATLKKRKIEKRQKEKKVEEAKMKKIKEETANLLSETVLSTEDFQRIQKLQTKKALELQMGRKSKDDTSSESEQESDNDSDSDDSHLDEGEKAIKLKKKLDKGVFNDMDYLDPDKLTGFSRKKHDKQTRVNSILKGREGRDKFGSSKKGKERSGGSTNKEKVRNKPMLMTIRGREVRQKKSNKKATHKLANLRKHVSTLKRSKGNKRRR